MGRRIYVFGAVKRPGPVDIPEDQQGINLTQAVAFAGLSDSNYEERHIRVIRSQSATRGELMVVDLKKILDGEALPFQLVENDIVFVPKGELGEWNQAISEMMPTLQAAGAFLQPFVQIRLLTSGR
jgi:polysaccharide export outer membrane protein